ncbi:MAG: hypothetical protein Q8M15_09310 [Bacteroidota bacterium]|nr:hypothetical protein [Bacteroidota bacterium]
MRKRFDQQLVLGVVPIEDAKFPTHSRYELPRVLKVLQFIFITPELNKAVFNLLENKISKGKKKTGRRGMDLWHILVLASIRHALSTNWDRLEYIANYDSLTRQVLGVYTTNFEVDTHVFTYQTIIDNVSLIDEEMLEQINLLVAEHGQILLKHKRRRS